jgi:hypothetical protein
MSKDVEEEKMALAKLPYSEATIQAALDDLQKKALTKQARQAKQAAQHP